MRALLPPLAALTLAAGAALAQAPAEPARPNGQGMVGEPLESGANSFTEAQVRERFGRMGFGEIRDLKKTDQGVWEGIATHAGKEVRIGMDYRGNVAAR
jgi:hypothetical protein